MYLIKLNNGDWLWGKAKEKDPYAEAGIRDPTI